MVEEDKDEWHDLSRRRLVALSDEFEIKRWWPKENH